MKNLSRSKLMAKPFQPVPGLPEKALEDVWIEGLISQLDSDRGRLDELINHKSGGKSSILDGMVEFDFKKYAIIQQNQDNQ